MYSIRTRKKVSDIPSSSFKIVKKKKKILNDWKCNKNLNQKRKRSEKESETEDALLEWFPEKKARNVPIEWLLLEQNVEDLARQFKINYFKAASGWLRRWKIGNQIYLKKNHGEASDSDEGAANSRIINMIPTLLQDYSSSYIYNCD